MLILIFSSGLTCWVILQRHKHCVSSPDPSDATGSYVLEAADPYMLEVLEELNKTLVPDTAEITAADPNMSIAGFYHLAMLGPWKEVSYHQIQAVRAKGWTTLISYS